MPDLCSIVNHQDARCVFLYHSTFAAFQLKKGIEQIEILLNPEDERANAVRMQQLVKRNEAYGM